MALQFFCRPSTLLQLVLLELLLLSIVLLYFLLFFFFNLFYFLVFYSASITVVEKSSKKNHNKKKHHEVLKNFVFYKFLYSFIMNGIAFFFFFVAIFSYSLTKNQKMILNAFKSNKLSNLYSSVATTCFVIGLTLWCSKQIERILYFLILI